MTAKPTEPVNVIILAAVSTIEQADNDKFSLDAQIADSRAVAEKNGWNVIDTIRIEGHSRNYRTLAQLAAAARINNEPGFDRLITHFEKRDFQIILCRDANRFARKASLLYEIVDIILEDCNARIYSLSDGMVDKSNADMWCMVKGYETNKQMKWIRGEMVRGRHKLVDEQGLPMNGKHVWSHMKVRDDKGKVIDFVPDPSKADVIKAAAQLVIDRVGWNFISRELFKLGYGNNGKPYPRIFFYRIFTNPWFWGDAARNHHNPYSPTGIKIELWCVDHAAPVPENIIIKRDVNPPALTGDLAVQLRAEIIRRMTTFPRNHKKTHLFTGLLVCQRCGYLMGFSKNRTHGIYYCGSKYRAEVASRTTCDRIWSVSELYTKRWLTAALTKMLEEQNPMGLIAVDSPVPENPLIELGQRLKTLEKQIQRLIDKQSTAPESLADMYDTQLEGLADQRENVLRRMDAVERETKRYNVADIQAAFHELTTYETLDAFWAADAGTINQLLHRLLGNRRLVVLDHKIVGTIEYQR